MAVLRHLFLINKKKMAGNPVSSLLSEIGAYVLLLDQNLISSTVVQWTPSALVSEHPVLAAAGII